VSESQPPMIRAVCGFERARLSKVFHERRGLPCLPIRLSDEHDALGKLRVAVGRWKRNGQENTM
jgi:hypothetical protein